MCICSYVDIYSQVTVQSLSLCLYLCLCLCRVSVSVSVSMSIYVSVSVSMSVYVSISVSVSHISIQTASDDRDPLIDDLTSAEIGRSLFGIRMSLFKSYSCFPEYVSGYFPQIHTAFLAEFVSGSFGEY